MKRITDKKIDAEVVLQKYPLVSEGFRQGLLDSLLKRYRRQSTIRKRLNKFLLVDAMFLNRKYIYFGSVLIVFLAVGLTYFTYQNKSGFLYGLLTDSKTSSRSTSGVIDLTVYRVEGVDKTSYNLVKKYDSGSLYLNNSKSQYLLESVKENDQYLFSVPQPDIIAVDGNGTSSTVNDFTTDSIYDAASARIADGNFLDAMVVYEDGVEKIVPQSKTTNSDTNVSDSFPSTGDSDSKEIVIVCPYDTSSDEDRLNCEIKERDRIYSDCVDTDSHRILETDPPVCIYPDGRQVTANSK
ncbi:hypothetical protein H6764_03525 [Candidatus Nomurabacteria bacterium]|nr:hypothetical protein [Candidatus Nomurabacteria bacterium]